MRTWRFVLAGGIGAVTALALLILPAEGTAPRGSVLFAELDGEKEVGGGDTDGYGSFSLSFRGQRICYGLTTVAIGDPTVAHIHRGAPGINGPIEFMLPAIPARGVVGAAAGCPTMPTALRDEIRLNPGGFYVNVHNGAFSGGALRGQLFEATAEQDE